MLKKIKSTRLKKPPGSSTPAITSRIGQVFIVVASVPKLTVRSTAPVRNSQRIQEARDFAGEDALVVYLDPADQNWIPELAARFGFAPVVSREAFMGGMRAVIRSKNILIDNSFATLLREAKEEFVFAGGMTDE